MPYVCVSPNPIRSKPFSNSELDLEVIGSQKAGVTYLVINLHMWIGLLWPSWDEVAERMADVAGDCAATRPRDPSLCFVGATFPATCSQLGTSFFFFYYYGSSSIGELWLSLYSAHGLWGDPFFIKKNSPFVSHDLNDEWGRHQAVVQFQGRNLCPLPTWH